MARTALIALSGASGLLGRTIVENLTSEIGIVHKVSTSRIDIDEITNQIKYAADSGAKYFLHLGWPASSSIEDYRLSSRNFDALVKTLEIKRACIQFGISFIGVGSTVDRFPIANNIYSLTKYVARQIFLEDILEHKITWLRPFYIFNHKSWPQFIYKAGGDNIIIENNTPRDYIHITDVIRGIESVIREGICGEVDLGSQVLRKPSDLCSVLGKTFSVIQELNQANKAEFQAADNNEKLAKVWHASETANFFKGAR